MKIFDLKRIKNYWNKKWQINKIFSKIYQKKILKSIRNLKLLELNA